MASLATNYAGIGLVNPIIIGASALTSNLDTIKKLEDAGAAAIVCRSLFEEQVQLSRMKLEKELYKNDDLNPEMLTFYPQFKETGPREHIFWVKKTKESVKIPVFASLNAVHEHTWIEYAKKLEDTGVDGLELNIYGSQLSHYETADSIEKATLEMLAKVRASVALPLTVKLSTFFTNIPNFVSQMNGIGINGFVLFNRFFQSDIDIAEEKTVFPVTYSRKEDNLVAMRFAGLLYGTISASICCNTGIMDGNDLIKMLLAGADAVEIVSTVFLHGKSKIGGMIAELTTWMAEKGYTTIADFKGKMSRDSLGTKDEWVYKRTQYIKILMQSSEELMKHML